MTISPNLMNDKTLALVAERFRLLGDPARLRLLHTLGEKELSVAELVEVSGLAQANVSKHLQLLLRAGLVDRRKEGLHVYYRVADSRVFQLCDVVCGSLAERLASELALFEPQPEPKRKGAGKRRR